LGDRVSLVVTAAGDVHAEVDAFGLGPYLGVVGRSVLDGSLLVADDLAERDAPRLALLEGWAAATYLNTTTGPRPWGVSTLSQFFEPERGTFAARTYIGAGFGITENWGRFCGLTAERAAPRRGERAGSWTVWLPGWGRQRPNGWGRASPHRPELWVRARRVGWQVEFAPCGKDSEGRQRGKRVNGLVWRGAFIDLMSLAYALDADRGATFADHRVNAGLAPVELPVRLPVDDTGAAAVTQAVQAIHELAVALDERASIWFTTTDDRAEGRGRLDLARISSPGAVAAEIPARLRVAPPLTHLDLRDEAHPIWTEAYHGGWIDVDPRVLGVPVSVVAADVSSAYPLVAHLIGWWDLMLAGRVEL
jgi:hypothetical protein